MTASPPARVMAWSAVVAALAGCSSLSPQGVSLIHDSFEDFSTGRLDGSGQNMYVSHDGAIRAIHRFDLNEDGYLDLVFNNTHNDHRNQDASVATVGRDGTIAVQPLPIRGSERVVSADFNADGLADLAFLPSNRSIQSSRQYVHVVWGHRDGWTSATTTGLLTVYDPKDLAVADLNHDGWPDLVVLSHPPTHVRANPAKEMVARVFWGSATGFSLLRFVDIPLPHEASVLAAADLDQDGHADLAVACGNKLLLFRGPIQSAEAGAVAVDLEANVTALAVDGGSLILADADHGIHRLNVAANGQPAKPALLLTARVARLRVADLDGDGHADLLTTGLRTSAAAGGEQGAARGEDRATIYWGGPDGFSADRALTLPDPYVSAMDMGDFNGDGIADLVLSVYQTATVYETQSPIWLNNGDRTFTRMAATVPTSGARDVLVVAADDANPVRTVICNNIGGTLDERVPIYIYWGDRKGFDPERRLEIPFTSGYECSVADLNLDGFTDLVLLNSGHAFQPDNPTRGANIFWGNADGFDLDNPTILHEYCVWTSGIADLNKDGHLDLVLGSFQHIPGYVGDDEPEVLVIYYGGADGFTRDRRVALPSPRRSTGNVIADYNNDGWLDIAVADYLTHTVRIFWGGAEGFDAQRKQEIEVPAAIVVKTADLNADGWLDLLVGSYHDKFSGHQDTGMFIFWGGPDGYSPTRQQWLPALTPVGITVADLDGDGHLDIFCAAYHGNGTRESLPSTIFWGGPDGYSPGNRSILVCDSASDALAGDFNGDGLLDLAVSCHTRDGDHRTDSLVFFNDGNRFRDPQVQRLPTMGAHWMYYQDMGHVAHRRFEQWYESAPLQWSHVARGGRLKADATMPRDTRLTWFVRSAASVDELSHQPWRPVVRGGFSLHHTDRCLQYRAVLQSSNGDRYPAIDRVRIDLPTR